MSHVPDGVRPEEGELSAGLCDVADLHLKIMHGWPGEMIANTKYHTYQLVLPVGSGNDGDFLLENC